MGAEGEGVARQGIGQRNEWRGSGVRSPTSTAEVEAVEPKIEMEAKTGTSRVPVPSWAGNLQPSSVLSG